MVKKSSQNAFWEAMGSPRESPGGQMRPKLEPKGSKKSSQNGVFSSLGGKTRNLTKHCYLLCFRHIAPPENDYVGSFLASKIDVETERWPNAPKSGQKGSPGGSEEGLEPKRVPKGLQKGSQKAPKMTSKSALGGSSGRGVAQRLPRGHPRGSKGAPSIIDG